MVGMLMYFCVVSFFPAESSFVWVFDFEFAGDPSFLLEELW